MNNRKRTALCLLGAALCVFMTFGAALALGRYPITPAALLAGDAMAVRTFTVLRLPRAVMALVGGFGLGAAGFVYQTVFRNPLASPDIIGVSSGASVGAAFAILFVSSGALSTTVCAFAGGLAAVFLSLGLAAAAPGRSKMSLVLAGIAVHALAQNVRALQDADHAPLSALGDAVLAASLDHGADSVHVEGAESVAWNRGSQKNLGPASGGFLLTDQCPRQIRAHGPIHGADIFLLVLHKATAVVHGGQCQLGNQAR